MTAALALACSLFANEPFEVGGNEGDTVPPTIALSGVDAGRTEPGSTCEPMIWIEVTATGDDDLGAHGFELTMVSGGLEPWGGRDDVATPGLIDELMYYFQYEPGAVAARFELRTVDRAGNRSAPATFDVALPASQLEGDGDGAGDGGGCAAGGGGDLGALALVLGGLAAARRRRTLRA